jgi:hypothetical protein
VQRGFTGQPQAMNAAIEPSLTRPLPITGTSDGLIRKKRDDVGGFTGHNHSKGDIGRSGKHILNSPAETENHMTNTLCGTF